MTRAVRDPIPAAAFRLFDQIDACCRMGTPPDRLCAACAARIERADALMRLQETQNDG